MKPEETAGKVHEMFYSMQGEVPGIGEPAIFIRMSGCNLKCSFCDSKYATSHSLMTVKEVLEKCQEFKNQYKVNHVIITGGEPTIQPKFLAALCVQLGNHRFDISIETNGTSIEAILLTRAEFRHLVVSPKLVNPNYRIAMEKLNQCATAVKIVYTTKEEVLDLITYYDIPRQKIVIMPKGATRKELRENLSMVWAFCVEYGYRMGYRLHIEMFDDKRGV